MHNNVEDINIKPTLCCVIFEVQLKGNMEIPKEVTKNKLHLVIIPFYPKKYTQMEK